MTLAGVGAHVRGRKAEGSPLEWGVAHEAYPLNMVNLMC